MPLNFSEEKYFQKALELAKVPPESKLSPEDAFAILVKDVPAKRLDNLISCVQKDYPNLQEQEIYAQLQGTAGKSIRFLKYAYEILEQQIPLGNEVIPGAVINTSDWIGHSLWEAKVCGVLAQHAGLDIVKASCLGMLHDIGRKETHTFEHTVRGFEMLTDCGLDAEALGCLTHSFINGGRCASNEKAEPGFYVSKEGLPCWAADVPKDQITLFLEEYHYTPYDRILNLADLMATSKNIVSPLDRIRDIATRRALDPVNRGYFLAELLSLCGGWLGSYETIRFIDSCTIAQMEKKLENTSDLFWSKFQEMSSDGFEKSVICG